MVNAEFYRSDEKLSGFSISGHAEYAERGYDVVCASVSSAVQLTVNLLSEFECKPFASVGDNTVECKVAENPDTAFRIIEQLRLHLESVGAEFPKTIKITISEV